MQRPNLQHIPVFYTLTTRTDEPDPIGRPIKSDCDGPWVRRSSFVDYNIQPIAKTKKISTLAKTQKSYLYDITDLINFTRKDDGLKLRNFILYRCK